MVAAAGPRRDCRPAAGGAVLGEGASVDACLTAVGLFRSVLPPERAVAQAEAVAGAMRRGACAPAYADCNAISPITMAKVAAAFDGTRAKVIDCGIIGFNPIKSPPTRFYVSGPDCSAIEALGSDAIQVETISDEIGRASAMKMVYAAGTKGVWTLQTALLLTAARHGVLEPLLAELEYSRPGPLQDMRNKIPFIPADAARWVPEMEEIAATFSDRA